jgi:hypothetical protein
MRLVLLCVKNGGITFLKEAGELPVVEEFEKIKH